MPEPKCRKKEGPRKGFSMFCLHKIWGKSQTKEIGGMGRGRKENPSLLSSFGSHTIFRMAKLRKYYSSDFLCSPAPRIHLLRRLHKSKTGYKCFTKSHQRHCWSICEFNISNPFGASWVAIRYNSHISNLKVTLFQDSVAEIENKGMHEDRSRLAKTTKWLTWPTFEKNSSKSLGLMFLASCMQKAVLASLSSGVISSAGLSSLLQEKSNLIVSTSFLREGTIKLLS